MKLHGHAIECRINAEDPMTFAPSPGTVKNFVAPGGMHVRVDSGLYTGYKVPPYYDSMIGKLIVYGTTRERCIMRLRRALEEFVIEGMKTTIPLHQALVRDQEFLKGEYTIKWLEQWLEKQRVAAECRRLLKRKTFSPICVARARTSIMASYTGTAGNDRAKALAGVVLVHVVLGAVIFTGLNVHNVRQVVESLKTFDIKEEPPPPPIPPPPHPRAEKAKEEEGAAGKKAEPSPIVVPKPKIVVPAKPPVPAAPVAGVGPRDHSRCGAVRDRNGCGRLRHRARRRRNWRLFGIHAGAAHQQDPRQRISPDHGGERPAQRSDRHHAQGQHRRAAFELPRRALQRQSERRFPLLRACRRLCPLPARARR